MLDVYLSSNAVSAKIIIIIEIVIVRVTHINAIVFHTINFSIIIFYFLEHGSKLLRNQPMPYINKIENERKKNP